MKKTLALLLAVMLCLGLFAACQSSELSAYTGDASSASDVAEDAANTEEEKAVDYDKSFASYAPDKVMLTVNGIDVTWRELYYWYYSDVSGIEYYYGAITDWDDTSLFNGEKSYRDYISENGFQSVKQYAVMESKAAELGVELDDEATAKLDQLWQESVDNYIANNGEGDETDFIEYLESIYLDEATFKHMLEVGVLYESALEKFSAGFSDEDILAEAAEQGYARAKHIFLSFTDAEGATITDEEKAAQKAKLQTILNELKTITDPEKLEAKVDEYTASLSEDTGKDYYTDGYTYTDGSGLDEAFTAAAKEIGENEIYPEIVESSLGYHVILRLPLSITAIVDYSGETEFTTLKDIIPGIAFDGQIETWSEEAEVETTKAYDKMDVAKIFGEKQGLAKTWSDLKEKLGNVGDNWYFVIIIVLLIAAIAVGIILIAQHGKANKPGTAVIDVDAQPEDEGEGTEPAAYEEDEVEGAEPTASDEDTAADTEPAASEQGEEAPSKEEEKKED